MSTFIPEPNTAVYGEDGTFSGHLGPMTSQDNTRYLNHHHSVWEMILILDGTGFMKVENQEYAFSPGTIFFIPPNMKHHNQADLSYYDFCIGLRENLTAQNKFSVFQDDENQSFLHLMMVYDHVYRTRQNNCGQILGHIRRSMQALLIGWSERQPSADLIQLTDEMSSNISNVDFKVSDAIAKIPLNANYVRKQFRETFGMTPVSYMNLLRVTEAKALLLATQNSVSEIALQCGFSDAKYFTRLFHSTTKYAPLEYRKTYERFRNEKNKARG